MKKKILIETVVDIVCPWCLVGKKNMLDAVRESSSEFDIEIRFLPYQLDPTTPQEGVPRLEYLRKKFGSESRLQTAEGMVMKAAQASGAELHFDRIQMHINTFDCHRLIWWAGQQGRQLEAVNALYDAYFVHGTDLSKTDHLVQVLGQAGFNTEEVKNFLNSEAGTQEVESLLEEMQNLGISGVPFFILNREAGISGAQPKEVFLQAFRQI